MTYPIFQWDEAVGELTVEPDGLYYTIRAELPDTGQMFRLYLVGREQTALLGTAIPQNGRLVCSRRLSRRQTPQDVLGAIVCCDAWDEWQSAPDGLHRMTPEQVELAQPYRQDEPVEGVEQYRQMRTQTIADTQYLVRSLTLPEYLMQLTQPPQDTSEEE